MPPKNKRRASSKEIEDDLIAIIDSKADGYIEDIKTFCQIASYPGISDYSRKMMIVKLAVSTLKNLGAYVEECVSDREFEGSGLPVILASLGADEAKPTALVYCQLDGTGQSPEFASSAKYMRGRAVIDTASFLIWINMIQAHMELSVALPYNIKFCLDPLSRSEVTQLIEILHIKKQTFLSDISFCFACLSHGINRKIPNIIYGVRGICEFFVKIGKENTLFEDNIVCEEVYLDMLYIMNCLEDSSGHILIDGILDEVPEASVKERIWFASVHLDNKDFHDCFAVNKFVENVEASYVESVWHLPALICKGIEISETNSNEMIGRFTVLTVPNQAPSYVRRIVFSYLNRKWKERRSVNNIELGMDYWGLPWRADQSDEKYRALIESIFAEYGEKPQLILSGMHLPFPSILRLLIDMNVVIFTLGTFYDFHLTKNERLSTNDYIKGIKVLTRMMHYVDNKLNGALAAGKKRGKK